MDATETNSLLDYGKPPWVFKGRALYQLHLVKAETARAFIPKEFKLVEAFGYTLGGFFLADYEDSPVGMFDELVVIAGIVWNPPTSCGWAARVMVNNDKACIHGRKDVGLPSQVAKFKKRVTALPQTKKGLFSGFLSKVDMTDSNSVTNNCMDVEVKEMNSHIATNICSIKISPAMTETPHDSRKWFGPTIKIALPSFSGLTEYNPHLLKYSCQIDCRVRVVSPAKVSGPSTSYQEDDEFTSEIEKKLTSADSGGDYKRNLSISVMLSKPILALEFRCLNMKVEAPIEVSLKDP